ncbi:uncharacterized protein LOC116338837 isoform X1 [Contarinia nasturtii]|uniref:uncharacterized protein LOC116338837 isoform X1 n=1 Tax=Contarinia nasturtii TaxID=265458 RepID=UPI0012D433CB|nr:uncharacterized protein LOC116338837 isoform X1 [Contarinia nasturtii]
MKFVLILSLAIIVCASQSGNTENLIKMFLVENRKNLFESARNQLNLMDSLVYGFYDDRINVILEHNINDYQGLIDEKTKTYLEDLVKDVQSCNNDARTKIDEQRTKLANLETKFNSKSELDMFSEVEFIIRYEDFDSENEDLEKLCEHIDKVVRSLSIPLDLLKSCIDKSSTPAIKQISEGMQIANIVVMILIQNRIWISAKPDEIEDLDKRLNSDIEGYNVSAFFNFYHIDRYILNFNCFTSFFGQVSAPWELPMLNAKLDAIISMQFLKTTWLV